MKQAKKNNSFFILFILAIIFSACHKNKIDDDTLVRIYVRNMIVEESQSPNSEVYAKQKAENFKLYNVTQKEFDEAILNMKDDKERWDSFFKKADALVDDLKKSGAIK